MAKHCKDFLRVKKHTRFRTDPALHGKQVAANDLPLDTPLPRGVRANTRPAPPWDASLLGACTSRFFGAVGALSLRPSGLDRRERSKYPQLTLASGHTVMWTYSCSKLTYCLGTTGAVVSAMSVPSSAAPMVS